MDGVRPNYRTRLIGRSLPSVAGFAIWMACSPFVLLGQEGTASLSGTVQDPLGVGIGGNGSIILESAADGVQRTTRSDQGNFLFSALPVGKYILIIRVPGFDSLKIKLNLLPGERKSLPPVRLNLASSGCFSSDADPRWTRFLSNGSGLGGLAGNVTGGQQPAANVRVTLACWVGRECQESPVRTRSDSQGDFEFPSIRAGRYVLTVEQDGFLPKISIPFVVVGGLESSYSISLTPCPHGDCTVKLEPSELKPIVCE